MGLLTVFQRPRGGKFQKIYGGEPFAATGGLGTSGARGWLF
jgi:hypothetical protein